MSYTTFNYQNPKVSSQTFRDVDGLTVSVDVTNTGKVAGKEVVQVYVHDHKSRLVRPPKELKGFAKVELKPGETKTVTVPLDFRAFAYYDPAFRQWITEDGEFDILIGASSTDICCTKTVTLQSTLELPSILNHDSTLRDWIEDPRGKKILEPIIDQLKRKVEAVFGGPDRRDIGMDPLGFLNEQSGIFSCELRCSNCKLGRWVILIHLFFCNKLQWVEIFYLPAIMSEMFPCMIDVTG